jgi:hypothetical protein
MKEEWLFPGAVVPVDVETTAALVVEIKRLIDVVGGMALKQQRTWVGLTDEEIVQGNKESWVTEQAWQSAVWWAEAKLKEKNT